MSYKCLEEHHVLVSETSAGFTFFMDIVNFLVLQCKSNFITYYFRCAEKIKIHIHSLYGMGSASNGAFIITITSILQGIVGFATPDKNELDPSCVMEPNSQGYFKNTWENFRSLQPYRFPTSEFGWCKLC